MKHKDKTKKQVINESAELRKRAEEKVAQMTGDMDARSQAETRQVFHELQVHQIELEMQNEELRRTHAELEASRSRYFDLYDLAPVGYFTVSEKGLILEANIAGAELLGVALSNLVRQPLSSFIRTEDQDIYYLHRKHLFETGAPQACELRLLRKDASVLWIRMDATLARNAEGEPVSRSVLNDVTQRKQIEEALQRSETRYRSLFEAAEDGILLLDAETGQILDVNPFLLNMLGYSHKDFLGKKLWEIGPFNDIAASRVRFSELQTKGYVRYEHLPLEARDGRLIDVEFVSNVYLVDQEKIIQCNIRDITLRKQAEEALQKAYDEMDLRVKERTGDLVEANQQLLLEIVERKKVEESLQEALREVKQLKDRLREENLYLKEEVNLLHSHMDIVGNSEAIRTVLKEIEQVAPTDSTVLIQGETGTGKELLAHAIHNLSPRKGRLMIKVNCAALPPTLIESELFGREKGAFTGALSKQIGRFEFANASTIFLDEIDSLPLDLQAKLLRVLESGEFERLGSPQTVKVNVRIISATNRDLSVLVKDGDFREDLYYRLHVFQITVPPLRERREDILPLLWSFVNEFSKRMGKRIESIPQKGVEALQAYPWPGNVRELRNVTERAMIITNGSVLHFDVPKIAQAGAEQSGTLEEAEKRHIVEALNNTGWRVSGKDGAADILGINPKTLESRMQKLGIQRNKKNI